jgi:hypothetical protein
MFSVTCGLLLFTFGLLAGIQVPGLVKDYSQRVEAHLIESRQALDGFRQTAERSSRATCRRWCSITAAATTRCSTAMPTASKAC